MSAVESKKQGKSLKNPKKSFVVPHVFVILFVLILIVTALTYIIPAGKYDLVLNEVTGKNVVEPNSFHYIDRTPINFLEVPSYIYAGIVGAASTIVLVMLSTAAIEVIITTGAFDIAIKKMIKRFKGREILLIVIPTIIFAFMGVRQNAMSMVGYVPLMVLLCRMCGYDALTGVSIIILGAGGAYSVGAMSVSITAVAQNIAGLPVFSGFGYRIFSTVLVVIVSIYFLIKYAKRVKADPKSSIVYELEQQELGKSDFGMLDDDKKMELKHILALLVFLINYVLIILGGVFWSWGNTQIASQAIMLAVIGGILGGLSPSNVAKAWAKGATKMTTACLMIGVAGSISKILAAGNIIDTIVFNLTAMLNFFPALIQPAVMYVLNCFVNAFITSGSGQAAAVMPLFLPTADLLGMTRQTAVLAFNYGDGFSNFLLPTSAALMGNIMAAGVTLPQWYKFFWKIFLGWSVVAVVTLMLAQTIQLGPF